MVSSQVGSMFIATKETRNKNHNNSLEILCKLIENPYISLRDVSKDLNVSYSFVQRTAKKYKYHAYLPTRVQQLLPTDYERRITVVAHMMVQLEYHPNFLEKIMWTDEARFHNNGTVNHHNNHYWSDTNTHRLNESNKQVRWGINVWCGIMNDRLVAHNTLAVRALLNDIFVDKWIGTQGSTVHWPPRFPDMTVLDFYFWGLKNRIIEIFNKIPASVLKKATTSELMKRLTINLPITSKTFKAFGASISVNIYNKQSSVWYKSISYNHGNMISAQSTIIDNKILIYNIYELSIIIANQPNQTTLFSSMFIRRVGITREYGYVTLLVFIIIIMRNAAVLQSLSVGRTARHPAKWAFYNTFRGTTYKLTILEMI
ncbi:hypothetical protein QTP88_010569 [Uroleucon formosanum]